MGSEKCWEPSEIQRMHVHVRTYTLFMVKHIIGIHI